jgi:hypothetical protein
MGPGWGGLLPGSYCRAVLLTSGLWFVRRRGRGCGRGVRKGGGGAERLEGPIGVEILRLRDPPMTVS